MKKTIRLVSLLLAIIMVVAMAACGSASGNTGSAPAGSANGDGTASGTENGELITVRIAARSEVADAPEGMTLQDNPFQTGWREQLGLNVEFAFMASGIEDYATKMNMQLAAGDMPDVCWVDAATYKMLLEDDMLEDLTDVIDEYATERTKEFMAQGTELRYKNVTVDGRIMGIVDPVDYEDRVSIVCIRKDWLEQLNLEAPKNMEDMWAIAKAFKEASPDGVDTVGVSAMKLVNVHAIGRLMYGYGGYNDIWLERNGQLEYSNLQPERRYGLERLAEKFAEGLIDPEFGTKDWPHIWEDAAAGRTGILVTDIYAPFQLLNAAKTGQEWGWYPLLTESGEVANTPISAGFDGAIVVRKGFEHPEAAVQLINFYSEHAVNEPEIYTVNSVNNFSWPFSSFMPVNVNSRIHDYYLEYLETSVMPEDPTIGGLLANSIEQAELFNKDGNMDGWILWNVFGPGGTEGPVAIARDNRLYEFNQFTGSPTEGMVTYSSVLATMEEEMMTAVIQGQQPIEAFDKFVEDWMANGGSTLIAEVNEWYESSNS